MEGSLCISVVDPSLDKSMPLINEKIFPSHCQKNIITVYRLCSFSFHLCYVRKAGAIQPLSSFRRVPCLIFLPLQIVDTEPLQDALLAFPVPVFISRPVLPSAALHFLQKREKFSQCPELSLQTMPSSSLPSFLSLLFTQVYCVLRSNSFKEFNLQTFP